MPSPKEMGLIQSTEGLNRTKRQNKREFTLPGSGQAGTWVFSCLSLRRELTPAALQVLSPSGSDWSYTIPSASLGHQPDDCKFWDFSVSLSTCANSLWSIYLPYWLFLWRTQTNTAIKIWIKREEKRVRQNTKSLKRYSFILGKCQVFKNCLSVD